MPDLGATNARLMVRSISLKNGSWHLRDCQPDILVLRDKRLSVKPLKASGSRAIRLLE